ncbi:MAG: MFS transporter [Oscillospiraceae bacterium]
MKKKIFDERVMSIFFLVCWVAYFSSYLGRLNFSASITEIVSQNVLNKSQAGLIGTAFFCSYGAGQLFSGILGDKVSSKFMVFTGLTASAVVNVVMGCTSSATVMIVLWLFNGFAQSLTWSPIVKIFADRLPRRQCVRACVNISTSMAAGTLGAYLMSAGCIALMGWRSVFFAGALLMVLVALLWFISITKIERHADQKGFLEAEEDEPSQEGDPAPKKPSVAAGQPIGKILIASGLVFLPQPSSWRGSSRTGHHLTPTYISEVFHLLRGLDSGDNPAAHWNLAGVYVADYLKDKVFHDELLTSGTLFLATIASLIILILFGKYSVILATLMLAVTTSAMLGINTMIIGLIPLYFARANRVSTVTGLLNALAYLGSAISTYGFGALSEYAGWNMTIVVWCLVAALGIVACLMGRRIWNRYKVDL